MRAPPATSTRSAPYSLGLTSRLIPKCAVVDTFFAVSKLHILSGNVHVHLAKRCGVFGRSIFVRNAGRTTSAAVGYVAIWWHGERGEFWHLIRFTGSGYNAKSFVGDRSLDPDAAELCNRPVRSRPFHHR